MQADSLAETEEWCDFLQAHFSKLFPPLEHTQLAAQSSSFQESEIQKTSFLWVPIMGGLNFSPSKEF